MQNKGIFSYALSSKSNKYQNPCKSREKTFSLLFQCFMFLEVGEHRGLGIYPVGVEPNP